MSEAFTNYDADEKDYDDDDETTSQQDQQKEPINFNEYQTPVSSVASYDSTESYSTNNDYSKQKENIYPSNPLSIANIVQNSKSNLISWSLDSFKIKRPPLSYPT